MIDCAKIQGGYLDTSAADATFDAYNLLLGFGNAYSFSEQRLKAFQNKKGVFYLSGIMPTEPITREYYTAHKEQFESVYHALADQKSKDSLEAYLNAKINTDAAYQIPFVEKPQYFSGSFLTLRDDESFVDCGAWRGDTICDFLEKVNGKYNRIFAFEPDRDNYESLSALVREQSVDRIRLICAGASDSKGQLRFSGGNGMYSKIDDNGSEYIQTETIDDVVGKERITFIAMDIEGAELKALHGAEQTIRKNKPTLAISSYHKSNDLFLLYEYIKSLNSSYKFYFRLHKALMIDSVLYAVDDATAERL